MHDHKFGPASRSEQIVFGAQRPGYPSKSPSSKDVQEWITFMKERGIKRICCLLPKSQLSYYEEYLLDVYRQEFGQDNICWTEVEDFHLCGVIRLKERILPFLKEAYLKGEPVVVHCSVGSGRTGHVLAAWLVHECGFSIEGALSTVKEMGRDLCEAVDCGNATEDELYGLLRACMPDK